MSVSPRKVNLIGRDLDPYLIIYMVPWAHTTLPQTRNDESSPTTHIYLQWSIWSRRLTLYTSTCRFSRKLVMYM